MRNPNSYMAIYMAAYRRGVRRRPIKPKVGVHPRPPRVFVPLVDQRHGHCAFCGLRSYATVCGFCRNELERAS
jgi:hypothetical protein